MSRVDLDQIQTQLKVAIQSHQILVAKMKSDPQNLSLQKQLHQLQSQITSLSEKQKSIVQLLRKELVNKQPQQASPQSSQLSGAIKHNNGQTCVVTCTVIPAQAQPVAAINLSQQSQPTNLSTTSRQQHQQHAIAITASPSNRPAQFIPPKPVIHTPLSQGAPPQQAAQGVASHRGPSPQQHQQQQHRGASPQQHRGASPPIRVPQYPVHRPSILQGHRQSLAVLSKASSSSSSSQSVSQSTPTVAPAAARKPSSTAELARDIKKAVSEKKLLSPEEKQKIDFMASLDLITHEAVKELQNKRSERKRRSTANPQFSYGSFDHEKLSKPSEPFPGTLAIVHSYIAHKTGKEEEKRKLQKRHSELENDRNQLELKAKQLSNAITKQIQQKSEMISNVRTAQQSVDKLKSFIKVFQST